MSLACQELKLAIETPGIQPESKVFSFCEADHFTNSMHFLKVSFKRSVTFDNDSDIFFVQKLCILHVSCIFHIFPHRWRPLKRFAVKPAWMAPW